MRNETNFTPIPLSRRQFSSLVASALATTCLADTSLAQPSSGHSFELKYMLASSLYGHISLGDILSEVKLSGATAIDLWPRVHGSQREQLDAMGIENYLKLIAEHGVQTGCLTRYDLGKANRFGELSQELDVAHRLGCDCIVTSAFGPHDLKGDDLKTAIKSFVKQLGPLIAKAEEHGIRLSIENHSKNLIESTDSLQWLAELAPSPNLAIALAPYHLEQDAQKIGRLIENLGPSISLIYAWQHGMGSMEKLPKEQELMQMPGRGPLDFKPILAALQAIDFQGWTEIFMHPVPRGIPILETEALVTEEINIARAYLTQQLTEIGHHER